MDKRNVIRYELIMDAGNGAQKAGDILVKAFADMGNYVYIEPIIPAEISPPKRSPHSMSGVVMRIAKNEIYSIGSYSDFMLVEHEILLDRRLKDKEYEVGCTILLDMGDYKRSQEAYDKAIGEAKELGLNIIEFNICDESKEIIKDLNGNGKNMYYLGVLTRVFNLEVETVEALIRQTFKKLSEEKLSKNIAIYKNGYKEADSVGALSLSVEAEKSSQQQILMDGNQALSMGIIDSGFKLFAGYPITPASSVMHTLAKTFSHYGGILHQAEDEISAIGAVVGGYFAGVPSITCTSGPGLSLKQEFIGLSMSSETPCVVIDVQRGGPSTGLPTRTEQSDLFAAAVGSHGDNTKIVLSVANAEDCFYAPHVARYLTEKLRLPVIIMSDYITSVSYRLFKKLDTNRMDSVDDISDDVLKRFGLKRLGEIKMVKDNQAVPGEEGGVRRITGLNTDITGNVVTTSASAIRSHQIRNEKVDAVRNVLDNPELMGDDSGDVLIIGWGSSRGAIKEAIELAREQGLKASGISLKIVAPLPPNLTQLFSKFKKVVTVEVAYGDKHKPAPLAYMLRAETLHNIESAIAEPSGRPLKPKMIVSRIKELVS